MVVVAIGTLGFRYLPTLITLASAERLTITNPFFNEAAVEELTIDPLAAYSYELQNGLLASSTVDEFVMQLRPIAGSSFGYGYYRAEWTVTTPEEGLAALAPIFVNMPNASDRTLPNEPADLLGGQNPYNMLGSEKTVSAVKYVQGLGTDGLSSALIYIVDVDGVPVWEATLIVPTQ